MKKKKNRKTLDSTSRSPCYHTACVGSKRTLFFGNIESDSIFFTLQHSRKSYHFLFCFYFTSTCLKNVEPQMLGCFICVCLNRAVVVSTAWRVHLVFPPVLAFNFYCDLGSALPHTSPTFRRIAQCSRSRISLCQKKKHRSVCCSRLLLIKRANKQKKTSHWKNGDKKENPLTSTYF